MGAKHTTKTLKKGPFSRARWAFVLCMLGVFSGDIAPAQQPQQGPQSASAIATNEVLRRQQMLRTAQQLIDAGAVAQTDRSYGEAMDRFRQAFELLPEAPAVSATRQAIFRRYQSATVQFAQQMIDEARWGEAKQALEAAVALGQEAGMPSSLNPGLKRMLANLNDPAYYATAISPQHIKNVQRVKELLITARGYMDYGDYDRAIKTYHRVLNIDRYNSAARRGIEEVERLMLSYYDVARDQTRATQLRKIAQEWETFVPRSIGVDSAIDAKDATPNRRTSIQEKLKTIMIPSLEVDQATLNDVLNLLEQQSKIRDFAESDPTLKGINLVLDAGSFGAGEKPGEKTLTLKITNVPLGVALKYVTRQTGTTYQVDDFAVRVVSTVVGAQQVLENRTWIVPPGFLNRGGGGAAPVVDDPFAAPAADDGGGGVLVKRKTAKEFLQDSGITFPDGAIANYNPHSSTLLVRNTADQIALIDSLVQSAREGVNKMVEVGIKMISISQEDVNQLGFQSLLGQFNLGSTPRVFAGGGTSAAGAANTAFPFNNGGVPVGSFPVSSGLRLGDFDNPQSIDQAISRQLGDAVTSAAPSVFAVSGPFTDPQFQTQIVAISQTKGVDFLCDTKLLIRPGQRGKIEVVREFIYPTEYDPPEVPNQFGISPSSTGIGTIINPTNTIPAVPATPTAFEMRPVGKILEVEPTVSADNHTVTLDLIVEMVEFSGFINYGIPITNSNFLQQSTITGPAASALTSNRIVMPVFDTVKEATNVTLWDGQTVAIGGLHGHEVTDTEDKIPFIGDLPALGRLFRSSTEKHIKTAIIIYATVRLIDPGGLPINQPLTEDDQPNEFPPSSGRPPYVPPPALAAPSAPWQK